MAEKTGISNRETAEEEAREREEFPPVQSYSLGSPEEAEFAVRELYPAYESTPGALEWLADIHRRAAQSAAPSPPCCRRPVLR